MLIPDKSHLKLNEAFNDLYCNIYSSFHLLNLIMRRKHVSFC